MILSSFRGVPPFHLKHYRTQHHCYTSFSTIQYNTTVKQRMRRATAADGFSTIQYNTTVKPGSSSAGISISFSTIQYNTTVKPVLVL